MAPAGQPSSPRRCSWTALGFPLAGRVLWGRRVASLSPGVLTSKGKAAIAAVLGVVLRAGEEVTQAQSERSPRRRAPARVLSRGWRRPSACPGSRPGSPALWGLTPGIQRTAGRAQGRVGRSCRVGGLGNAAGRRGPHPSGMAALAKTKRWGNTVGEWTPSARLVGMENGDGNSRWSLKKLQVESPHDRQVHFWGCAPKTCQQGLQETFGHPCSQQQCSQYSGDENGPSARQQENG